MERIAVSVAEAAEMLGMCPKTVYQLTRRADFPAFKAGNRTVISVEACRNGSGGRPWERGSGMMGICRRFDPITASCAPVLRSNAPPKRLPRRHKKSRPGAAAPERQGGTVLRACFRLLS